MTFEVFDDLRLWADTLQDNLICSRFFASLFSAPKTSRLHSYVLSPTAFSKTMGASGSDLLGSTELAQSHSITSVSTTTSSTYYTYFSSLLSRVIHYHRHSGSSNGFLHVTVDRILFVTISQGRKPALVASWNFTNGEISVYGTGRISATSGDSENKIFYLMEAADRYVFACDKAIELSTWIQRVTRPASYLYERRWLSSVTSQLGQDQAILPMPFTRNSERKFYDASPKDTSEIRMDGSQQAPSCSQYEQNDSLTSAGRPVLLLPIGVIQRLHMTSFSVNASVHSLSFKQHKRAYPSNSASAKSRRLRDSSLASQLAGSLSFLGLAFGLVSHSDHTCRFLDAFHSHCPLPSLSVIRGITMSQKRSLQFCSLHHICVYGDPTEELLPSIIAVRFDYKKEASSLGSYRTRMRFLSHPTDQPVLSTGQLRTVRQQDSYVLRHSYSNVSTGHDTRNQHRHHHMLTERLSCRVHTSGSDGTDQQVPIMVALSPLPLDYLPCSAESEAKLEVDVEAGGEEHNAAITTTSVSSNRSGATSPSPPPLPLSFPNSAPVAPHRFMRSRLANSWSTSPGLLSASSSSQGVRMIAPCARASSECRHCDSGGGRGQQWQHEVRQPLLVGVTCSVPWDAAATGEKPRTGRLYLSREEIQVAALKAATTVPLSSLPSAGPFSCSSSFSGRDDDDDIDNLATSGGHEQTSLNFADAASATPSRSSPAPASFPLPSAPPSARYYVNLGPVSPSSLSDGSSVHRLATMATAIASVSECTSSATDSTIAASSSAIESVSPSANYLSYTPYVPLSRQRSSGNGCGRGRIRTFSSGQPSVRRNPLLLTRQAIYDRSQQSPRLPTQPLGSLPRTTSHTGLISPPTDVSDASKLASLQTQGPHGPPGQLRDDSDSPAVHHSTEAISFSEAVVVNRGVSNGSSSTVGEPRSNYVAIDVVETLAPSCLMQRMPSAGQYNTDASNISNSNSNSNSVSHHTTNSSVYTDQCSPKVV
ncbi:hypothetical protein EGR_09193 [Echinococcus granulosus]|uniref:PH domain-containing protein n=1 Tax=Echinococcus granulosus TaxID=6210 RepID=W6U6J4_ECHGR|nr:hypothetical protein EGR_09193 [Echinococcus granulosus]EUB55946.1 hypothetical protein EGR_09193 [Echinococcus granulosus]